MRILHRHLDIVSRIFRIARLGDNRRMEFLAEGSRSLTGNAYHAEAVHPVGGYFVFEDHIV